MAMMQRRLLRRMALGGRLRRPRRRLGLVLVLLVLALGIAAALRADTLERVEMADGRFYLIALPEGGGNGAPLILALHGGGGNPAQLERNIGMSAAATRVGFAVAYPAGSGRGRLLTWNALNCCAYALEAGMDDVGFLERVISDVASRHGIDQKRVFVTGMSNGSMMAEVFAAARPGKVRAVAGVAGTLDVSQLRPKVSVPLLHIHGTDDRHVLYTGGPGPDAYVDSDFASVQSVLDAFLAVAPAPLTQETKIEGATERMIWRHKGRIVLMHLKINGGGHVWPGGARAGRAGEDFGANATAEILRFFAAYR